jgi:dTDP-4-dehydrorhamnose reductase
MVIVLLGKNGQLGWELQRSLSPLGEVVALDYPQIDVAQPDTYVSLLRDAAPRVIINAAAYTDVERAEAEPERAFAVNGTAPGVLAEQAAGMGAALIHYSTDFVFDGKKTSPYLETDPIGPLNQYGVSKLAGEQAVLQAGKSYLILRTAWLYSLRGHSFITRVLQWARQRSSLRMVTDQVGSPTWARLLAEVTALLLARGGEDVPGWLAERRGVYHLACSGQANRLQWAQEILRLDPHREEQVVEMVLPARSEEFPSPVKRPAYSVLDCSRFNRVFNMSLPEWRLALRLAMDTSTVLAASQSARPG